MVIVVDVRKSLYNTIFICYRTVRDVFLNNFKCSNPLPNGKDVVVLPPSLKKKLINDRNLPYDVVLYYNY